MQKQCFKQGKKIPQDNQRARGPVSFSASVFVKFSLVFFLVNEVTSEVGLVFPSMVPEFL